MKKNIIFPHPPGKNGGPGSFQIRFCKELEKNNISFSYHVKKNHYNKCLVVNGTSRIFFLIYLRLKKIEIIHRVDGLVWEHKAMWPGFYAYTLSAIRSFLVLLIRNFFSSKTIYLSKFVYECWKKKNPKKKENYKIIYNAISNNNHKKNFQSKPSIICVEGSLNSDIAYKMLNHVSNIKVDVFGEYDLKKININQKNIFFHGIVNRDVILKNLENEKIFLCLEINPACPNSVIEALSYGIPVIGFDTGALREIIGKAGFLLTYDADPWKLQHPNYSDIDKSIELVSNNYQYYSNLAYQQYMNNFQIEKQSSSYLDFIF